MLCAGILHPPYSPSLFYPLMLRCKARLCSLFSTLLNAQNTVLSTVPCLLILLFGAVLQYSCILREILHFLTVNAPSLGKPITTLWRVHLRSGSMDPIDLFYSATNSSRLHYPVILLASIQAVIAGKSSWRIGRGNI